MASTGSSDVENDEENNDQILSPKKVGRAAEYPEFAIIWSYLENFCELLRFPELSLDGLEDGFNSHSSRNENCQQLEYLHKKLLVKLNRKFRPDKWEKALLKMAKEQNMLVSWDLENFGYDELKVCTKLELFKMLLECQFDTNNKLKTVINKSYEADELRLQPFGHDMDGLLYWFHMDEVGGVRLYSTEEDEVDHESWKLLASDLEELENVLEYLAVKCETNPKDIVIAKREEEKQKKQEQNKNTGKKGRKNKKAKQEEEDDDDNPCARCFSNVHPDSILLCDKCDAAYHTACLRPPLLNVPSGDWFCPFCQQLVLLERLKEKRTRLVARQKLRARQAKRLTKSGMNLSNILQAPGSDEEQADAIRRSGRARKTVDYTFRDFDEEILDAVEKDKKPSLEEGEMNGHPTGKPSFAVERFYSSSSSKTGSRRRSRRLKDLDSGSDSESRISDYEYEGSTDDDRPKRSERERHIYLRRHLLDDDDDDESEAQTNGVGNSDNDSSDVENGPKTKKAKIDDDDDDDESDSSKPGGEKPNKSPSDSQDTNKDDIDASSEKSGPTVEKKDKPEENNVDGEKDGPPEKNKDDKNAPNGNETTDKDDGNADKTEKDKDDEQKCDDNTKDKDEKAEKSEKKEETQSDDQDSEVKKDQKKDTLDVPKSRPPPLERISPKIDPLLDSLGFGALASFSNSDRYPGSRPDQYGTLRSPSQTIRSPLSSDTGFSSDRLGVPASPSSYPRVSGDSRYSTYPPSYDQSASYASYLGYNQANFSSSPSMDGYPGSPSSRQSYPGLSSYPGARQYPAFSPTSLSKRDSSPSYNPPPPPYGSTGYPYPSNDMTSRSSFYPSTNQGYSFPSKNPYSVPQSGYYPDDPYGASMFYGNTGSSMQQVGGTSWPTTSTNSSTYYPPTG